MNISPKHCLTEAIRAREGTFLENIHPSPCVIRQVSHVMFQVSPVTYHLSLSVPNPHARARKLTYSKNVHLPPHVRECSPLTTCFVSHVTCHMSYVTCHMSHVTCHMSHVTWHMSHVMCHISILSLYLFFGQSGGASWWRVCYQLGLPRLVFYIYYFNFLLTFNLFLPANKCQVQRLPTRNRFIGKQICARPTAH